MAVSAIRAGSAQRDADTVAPGSLVVVRDEDWLVRATEKTSDGLLVRVQGLSELVRDTGATFYQSLDRITPLDLAKAVVKADASPRYRATRLCLESTIRKTAIPLTDPTLTVSTRVLVDRLGYQQSAVRRALARPTSGRASRPPTRSASGRRLRSG